MTASTQFPENSASQHAAGFVADPLSPEEEQHVLTEARKEAQQQNKPFAGSIAPPDAWKLVQAGLATLVDVRSAEERKFVGAIPDSIHVAWMTGLSLNRNPRFVKEFEIKIKNKEDVVLLICRSGKRSAAAAEVLTKSGFANIFNVETGFEGDINEDGQRGLLGGWRSHSLPWIQD